MVHSEKNRLEWFGPGARPRKEEANLYYKLSHRELASNMAWTYTLYHHAPFACIYGLLGVRPQSCSTRFSSRLVFTTLTIPSPHHQTRIASRLVSFVHFSQVHPFTYIISAFPLSPFVPPPFSCHVFIFHGEYTQKIN